MPKFFAIAGAVIWLGIISVVGCSDVPRAYRINNDSTPSLQDENVRFRTTYFLRVFDLCNLDEGIPPTTTYERRLGAFTSRTKQSLRIVKDSLYRFRMTGQASALYSNIRFESGILRANQIDPFTTKVQFNEKQKSFEVNEVASADSASRSPLSSSGTNKPNPCPDSSPTQTQFYLLGPEGVRKLEPDDRLIMAMSSDAKPLISALERLSGQRGRENDAALRTHEFELERHKISAALAILAKVRQDLNSGSNPPEQWSPLVLGEHMRSVLVPNSEVLSNKSVRPEELR
jgi:hypothetical protein